MKITCDNCAAKYSIADEKVKGKVFKIRCKKCSQIIVVRGTDDGYGAGGGEDEGYDAGAAGAGYGEQDAAVWHVVIGRDQVGPMTADEVRDRFAAGEINVESYIWREGFSDWLRLTAVDDFADMGQSTAVAPAAAGWEGQQAPQADAWAGGGGAEETQRADSAALFGASGQPESQDLFATGGGDAAYAAPAAGYDAAPAGGGVFTSSPEPAAGGDLFAGAAAGPAADPGGGLFSEDPREQVPSDPSVPVKQMTGQRGENSVLFSLANLQSLAMGDGGGGGGSARPEPAAPKAGMASGGGSGLIDIRAMAASAATSGGPAASPRSVESLPPMGGFGGPIASAPVLMPSSGGDRPGWLLPVVIGGSVVVLGLAITLVLVIALKKDPQPQPQVALNTPGTAGGSATGAPTKDPAKDPVKAGGTTENATGTTPGTAAKKPDDTKDDKTDSKGGKGDKVASNSGGKTKTRRHRGGGRRTPRKGTTHRGTTRKPTRVAANTPTPRKKRGGKRDELDDLLDGAMGKKRKRAGSAKPKAAAPPPSSNLPDRLERHQIVKGMQGIKPSIKRCFDRFRVPGMAMVRVSIGGSGRVSRAKVTGLFAGTPTGACISGAVKSARFARTKNPTTITYPFNLR